MPLTGPQGLNRDSSDEEGEAQNYESEIQFTDNPILKDFFNLSNGGSRFVKANQESRRHTTGASNAAAGTASSGPGSQTKIFVPQNNT